MQNRSFRARLCNFAADEVGSVAIEYGLIASLVCITIIAGSNGIRTQLKLVFDYVATQLATAIVGN